MIVGAVNVRAFVGYRQRRVRPDGDAFQRGHFVNDERLFGGHVGKVSFHETTDLMTGIAETPV